MYTFKVLLFFFSNVILLSILNQENEIFTNTIDVATISNLSFIPLPSVLLFFLFVFVFVLVFVSHVLHGNIWVVQQITELRTQLSAPPLLSGVGDKEKIRRIARKIKML